MSLRRAPSPQPACTPNAAVFPGRQSRSRTTHCQQSMTNFTCFFLVPGLPDFWAGMISRVRLPALIHRSLTSVQERATRKQRRNTKTKDTIELRKKVVVTWVSSLSPACSISQPFRPTRRHKAHTLPKCTSLKKGEGGFRIANPYAVTQAREAL